MWDVGNKICVGTTKLGMPYGAINQTQVESSRVEKIFSQAIQLDFQSFDTAPSYGTAEQLIGHNLPRKLRQACITKVVKITNASIQTEDLDLAQEIFQTSLQNMQTQSCYGLLVHDVQDLYKPGADQLVAWMQSLKDTGRVNKIGVSVYTPEEADKLFSRFEFDLVQLPCNIYDQRFLHSSTIDHLVDQGVEVHARSLFLKGLLLTPLADDNIAASHVPKSLIEHHAKFAHELDKQKKSAYEVCLSFAKEQQKIDRWVVGVSSPKQLQQLVEVARQTSVDMDFNAWAFNDHHALDPRQW